MAVNIWKLIRVEDMYIQYNITLCGVLSTDIRYYVEKIFVATVSENTEEQIRKYIQNQKVK